MGAQLNIKSEDAYRLASELASLTGESLTAAVTAALRERLARERRERDIETRLEKLREITADIRRHMDRPEATSDHSWLYGDDGLPR
ncbi:MAG: type II toxin-antitoxin system VapB family antitoxin [Rhodospirillales bacterium]|nr:type II toxin-antitoxin system VapB family antitoxin [Rhodospirillales bacterium]